MAIPPAPTDVRQMIRQMPESHLLHVFKDTAGMVCELPRGLRRTELVLLCEMAEELWAQESGT